MISSTILKQPARLVPIIRRVNKIAYFPVRLMNERLRGMISKPWLIASIYGDESRFDSDAV